jgi:hypothetical protein
MSARWKLALALLLLAVFVYLGDGVRRAHSPLAEPVRVVVYTDTGPCAADKVFGGTCAEWR